MCDFRYFYIITRDLFIVWIAPLVFIDYIRSLLCLRFDFNFFIGCFLKTLKKKKFFFILFFFILLFASNLNFIPLDDYF